MRVVSGKARGTRLDGPKGLETRPTAGRIKEALFSMISIDINNASFLDLFSGSGGIGIEALSRGARDAVFIEESSVAYKSIMKNLEKTKLQDKAKVMRTTINKGLYKLGKQDKQFNMIFMDPPYEKNMVNDAIQLIIDNDILALNGYIIIERSTNEKINAFEELIIFKEKQHKTTTLSFMKGKEDTCK